MKIINGVIILDKPEGLSSNQALQKVKRLFSAKKAGHTGSLDLLASGVLPICFGEATKFSKFLLEADKYYRVCAKLGERTTTCDREGDIIEKKPVDINKQQLLEALAKFNGETEQVPSMYSALKHKGQPLYKLARKGLEVVRKPRKIHVSDLVLLDWQIDTFTMDVYCSKGTYIRNLVDDIGQVLGCGASVLSLRRLQAGDFTAEQMLTLDKLTTIKEQGGVEALGKRLLPIDTLLTGLRRIDVDAAIAEKLQHGQKVSPNDHAQEPIDVIKVYCDNIFLGIAEVTEERILKSKRMLSKTAAGFSLF